MAAFIDPLRQDGWTVDGEVDFVDVKRDAARSGCMPKPQGRTAAIGSVVDTMYGQLLRRMKNPESGARYAVVVPTAGVQAAYLHRPGTATGMFPLGGGLGALS